MAFNYATKIYPITNPRSKLVAYASLVIEEKIEFTGFKIFQGSNGLFAKGPQHKGTNKEGEETWYDDVRFLGEDKTLRDEIYQTMIDSFSQNSTNTSTRSAAAAQSSVNKKNDRKAPLW